MLSSNKPEDTYHLSGTLGTNLGARITLKIFTQVFCYKPKRSTPTDRGTDYLEPFFRES
jgi:hypothetical protein